MNGGMDPETLLDSAATSPMDAKAAKPPCHYLTSIRHCASSARIAAASTDFGLDLGTLSLISPTNIWSMFVLMFRSDSCAEIGPKSYMEDEHVCVDNIVEHLGGRTTGSQCRAPSTRCLMVMVVQMQLALFGRTYSSSWLKMGISPIAWRRQYEVHS